MAVISSATDLSRLQSQSEVATTQKARGKQLSPETPPSVIVHLSGSQVVEDDGYGHLSDKKHGRWSSDPNDIMKT